MQVGELERPDGWLHYAVSGRNHAPALVLLHPLGASSEIWRPQLQGFEQFFRVIRLDLRGHGQSRLSTGPFTAQRIDTYAQDVLALLDHLTLERAHCCGLSLGGAIALQVAARQPLRVARLVLANTAASFPPAAMWDERIETALGPGVSGLLDSVPARWLGADFRAHQPEVVEQLMTELRKVSARGYAEACAALRDWDLSAELAAVRAPTLVIAGAGDISTPVQRAEELVTGIEGADLLVLDAGHLSNVEQAEDFTTAVIDFLRD
jgi:3-oxoadipate enol-lactonase